MLGVIVVFKGENMQWSADNTPTAIQGKSLKLRELFAKVANASLDKGFSKEESIFAGTNAVKIEERKNQPAKVKAPKLPSHVEALRSYTNPFEVVSKAENIPEPVPEIKSIEFDATGRLVISMSNGKKIITKNKAAEEHIHQAVTITQDNKAALAMQEPTGFQTRSTSTISFDDSNRTFTIAATNAQQGFNVWLHASEHTYFSESVQITDTTGVHFIYFDYPSETLQTTTTVSSELFLNAALVALVYWRQDQQKHIYFADERHGIVMDGATHQHLHLSIGAQYRSGLSLNNILIDQTGNLATHAQFSCQNGSIADEDITISITNNAPQILSTAIHAPVFYRIGADTNWYKKTATEYALILPTEVPHYLGTVRPAYNYNNGSGWILGQVPNNQFLLIHVLATNDIETPVVAVLGNTYATKSEARAGTKTELRDMTGLPFLEFVKLGSIIFQTADSYTNHPKARIVSTDTGETYLDYRTSLATLVLF
jgi:hypothetical protein